MPTAIYVYCVVRASRTPGTARVPPGVPGGAPPRVLRAGPSTYLVVSEVPLASYSGAGLERVLADVDDVGRIALAHEAVIEHFTKRPALTVIPMKLFTLFSSPERAVEEIASRRREITAAARRIAGAEEWGVRITRTDGSPAAAMPSTRSNSGAAFLGAKKQARDNRRAAGAAAAAAASGSLESLARFARDARVRKDPVPEGATPPLIEAALLVPVRRRARFKTAVEREAAACAQAGARLVLTGPWPAYSFVSPEEAAR